MCADNDIVLIIYIRQVCTYSVKQFELFFFLRNNDKQLRAVGYNSMMIMRILLNVYGRPRNQLRPLPLPSAKVRFYSTRHAKLRTSFMDSC